MCGEIMVVRRSHDDVLSCEEHRASGSPKPLLPHPDHLGTGEGIGDWSGNYCQRHVFAKALLYWALRDPSAARELAHDFVVEFVSALPAGGRHLTRSEIVAWQTMWIYNVLKACPALYTDERGQCNA